MRKKSFKVKEHVPELSSKVIELGKDNPYKGPEYKFQVNTNDILSLAKNKYKDLMAYHVPNEGKRSTRPGQGIRQQGAQAGVSDWFLMRLSSPWKVAYIELKAARGKLSPNQVNFLNEASLKGAKCYVCWNMTSFSQILDELAINPENKSWTKRIM